MSVTHLLYENHPAGPVELVYEPNPIHKYFYFGEWVPNVTSISDVVAAGDKVGALMGWAVKLCAEELRRLVESEHLGWDEAIKLAKAKHREKKKEAANKGTDAHDWVEAYIASKVAFADVPAMPSDDEVRSAVEAFLKWEDERHVLYRFSERKVFSLKHRYAGTLDIFADVDGSPSLIDLKTSNAYRHEYAVQTAAYAKALEEEHSDLRVEERFVLMLGKERATLDIVDLGSDSIESDFSAFLGAKAVYEWAERIKAKR